jgi:kumamolisin
MNQHVTFANAIRRGFPIQFLMGLCALVFVLTGCGSQQSNTPNPQNTPVTLPSLQDLGQLPPGAQGAIAQGALSPDTTIQLNIGLQTNRQQLTTDLAALYDPNSANYLHFFKPAELASRYGASQATVDQVSAFLTSQGFQIMSVSKLHDSIKVKATVAQIALAFHVALQNYQLNGQTFFGPSGQFGLPAAVKPLITYVQGLSSFAQPHHDLALQPAAMPQAPAGGCNTGSLLVPGQIATTYNYTGVYNKGYYGGVKIGVVEFNDAVSGDDVNAFLNCTVKGAQVQYNLVQVDGGATTADSGASGEATLDIEYLAALAPHSEIDEYQGCIGDANTCNGQAISFATALADVFNQIAQDAATPVVSVSWGDVEEAFTQDDILAVAQNLQQLASEGITVAVSSGDCGAYTGGKDGYKAVSYPASDTFVLGVGGTILQVNSQGQRKSEIAWSNPKRNKSQCGNDWGGGGGISKVWKLPDWQTGKGVKNKYSDNTRQVPDVAAVAYNVFEVFQGKVYQVEGTSIAAPVWAAGLALVDEGLIKNKNELLGDAQVFYQVANQAASKHPYYDITQGNNLYYPATGNWDFATGWGSPNMLNFGNAFGAFSK